MGLEKVRSDSSGAESVLAPHHCREAAGGMVVVAVAGSKSQPILQICQAIVVMINSH
jgi:hypothetical protein